MLVQLIGIGMPTQGSLFRRTLAPMLAQGKRLARDESGVTVIEFGILALPFFTLIFAILQTAIVFLGTQVLDSALEDGARMVRTGQAQNASWTSTDLRNYMCGYTFGLIDCSKIFISVKTINDFDDVAFTEPTMKCTTTPPKPEVCKWDPDPPPYTPGNGRTVVQVSAYYRWPLVVVLPYFNLKNQTDNYRMISAFRVFRNEPFGGTE
jgi:Flp pilus assembly protein TadG